MNQLSELRFPLMRRIFGVGLSQSSVYMWFDPVPTGRIWVVKNIAVENETTLFTSLRVLIRDPGYDHYILEDYSLLPDRLYWHDGELWIPEGRALGVLFVGTTTGDVLRVYINGFQLKMPEGFGNE
jgi:hypothetical protein